MSDMQMKRVEPGAIDTMQAGRALRRITDYLQANPLEAEIPVKGEHSSGDTVFLPREVVTLIAFVLEQAARGRGVTVVPSNTELTTQQAADLLNVSRPYLIKLLESKELDYRKVGRHRRVAYQSLIAYKASNDAKRRSAADELGSLGQELGI